MATTETLTTSPRIVDPEESKTESLRESEVVVGQIFSDPAAYFERFRDRASLYNFSQTGEDGQESHMYALTLTDFRNHILLEEVRLTGEFAAEEQEAGGSDHFVRLDTWIGKNRFISLVQPMDEDASGHNSSLRPHIVLAESTATSGVEEEEKGLKPTYTKVFFGDTGYDDLLEEFLGKLGTDIEWNARNSSNAPAISN